MRYNRKLPSVSLTASSPLCLRGELARPLLDGVQPLLLGGLLGFELGLLLRVGFGRDLGVELGELGVELLLEAGLAGVGLRIGLLPSGILDGLDLLVNGVETVLDAAHIVTRHVTDLIPLFLNLGQLLAGLLGLGVGLHRHQSLGLDQQSLLGSQILLLGGVDLIAIGLTSVEEGVGGFAELGPQLVVLVTASAAGLLPTVHQIVELAGSLTPSGGILELI
ncbi:hypothetical protein HMPREF1231_0130, partial [Streptococcus pyogenes GA06023]